MWFSLLIKDTNMHTHIFIHLFTIYVDKSKYTQICASFTTVMKVLTLERTDKKMNEHVTAI